METNQVYFSSIFFFKNSILSVKYNNITCYKIYHIKETKQAFEIILPIENMIWEICSESGLDDDSTLISKWSCFTLFNNSSAFSHYNMFKSNLYYLHDKSSWNRNISYLWLKLFWKRSLPKNTLESITTKIENKSNIILIIKTGEMKNPRRLKEKQPE